MNKKAAVGVVTVAVVAAYVGGTWWTGAKMQSTYNTTFAELPAPPALVRVVEQSYERKFFGAISTVTLEIGCAADTAAETTADTTPPAPAASKPRRITVRSVIHHGPLAGGTLAAATVDSELVLDPQAQAEAAKLFGTAKPLTAHTQISFGGATTSDITVAPAKFSEEGKDEFTWQGAQAHVDVSAARDRVRYELTGTGLDASSHTTGLRLKLGKFNAKADLDYSVGRPLAAGKTEGRLESLEIAAPNGLGPDASPHNAMPKIMLQGIELLADARIKDGLYGSTATLKGKGQIGETAIDSFEMTSTSSRVHAAGYKKIMEAWMHSDIAGGCSIGGPAARAAMQALVDQVTPELKAMAKYSPEFALDKMEVAIGGKRAQLSYTASLVGVTDDDLTAPGAALLMKRGVIKANARLPAKWLEQLAEAGARNGQTPPPEAVAGLIDEGEARGFVKRDGDDVISQLEFSEGSLKINGKPMNAMRR